MELKKLSSVPQIYRNLARWREILGILSKYGLADLLSRFDSDFARGLFAAEDGAPLAGLTREQRIRKALTEIGPTGIKLGQILSTRPDLVGVELATELEKLQSKAPESAAEEVRRTIERELGLSVKDLFAEFDDRPLASASIAQVHPARLANGDRVVVKVQHHGVREKIRIDLDILAGLAHRAERIDELASYRPRQLVAEFQRIILRELDFGSEERHLEEFRSRFADDPHVEAPRPYPELTTGRVLTMERFDGIKVSERQRLVAAGSNLDEIARRGANLYVEMIFQHGFYHADPHPGNIMILPGNVIGLIDFGMVGRLDERLREEAEVLLLALATGDGSLVTDVITRLGEVPHGLDESALAVDVAEFVSRFGTARIKDIRLDNALGEMTELIRRYGIVLPSSVSMVIKVLIMLEGTSRQLSPTFDLIDIIKPHRTRLLMRRLSPRRQLRKLGRMYRELEHLVDVLPGGIIDIVQQIRSGTFDVHLDHRGLEPSVNRLVLGMMCSSLFVGSSLLLAFAVPPVMRGVSILGAIGAVASVVAGLRLLRAISKSGHLHGRR